MVATREVGRTDGPPLLRIRNLSKTFGATKALSAVDLDVRAGEVLGLVGRNGSGKSTLIKILSGFHAPDDGATLELRGAAVSLPLRPAEVQRQGLSFVHQDLGLLPDFSVVENLRLGRYATRTGGLIDWKAERRTVGVALERFGVHVSPDTPVRSLRDVDRALVAIVRALLDFGDKATGVLILDEPTAYLPRDGVERLFAAVRTVAGANNAVMFVSHRLDEVMQLTERVAVLRDGSLVADMATSETDESQLIERILGRALEGFYPEQRPQQRDRIVTVEGLSGQSARNISFVAHRGEIVGLTGLSGAGHEEVPALLFGAKPAERGTFEIGGQVVEAARMMPRRAMALGMAFLPADRVNASGAQDATLAENVSLPVLDRYTSRGRVRGRHLAQSVERLLNEYGVRPTDPTRRMRELSGGNQQKSLLAKWMQREPPLLLLHEPTQGVDVGAKKEIFSRIQAAAASGAAVVIASVEYEDLAHLCHRVLVFRDGAVAAVLDGAELTEDRLVNESYRSSASVGG